MKAEDHMYNFDRYVSRKGTNCIKWDTFQEKYQREDMISFGIADTDFETLPEIQEALLHRCQHAMFGYTFEGEAYYDAIIGWFDRRHHLKLMKEEILSFPSVLPALSAVLDVFSNPGDSIVLNPPVYHPFYSTIENMGRTIARAPLCKDGEQYRLDYAGIEKRFQEGAKLFVFCSPHNPVGRVWTEEELFQLVELCVQYKVLLVVDEIHCDLVLDGNCHTPIFNAHPKAGDQAILLTSPSKTFNIAGLKCAVALIRNPKLREPLDLWLTKHHIDIDLLAVEAVKAAYTKGDRWVDEQLAYLSGNAHFACRFFQENLPIAKTYCPEGTYLMWVDLSALHLPQEELMQRLVDAGIVVTNGNVFRGGTEGFIRMNIGTTRNVLEAGLKAICGAFQQ